MLDGMGFSDNGGPCDFPHLRNTSPCYSVIAFTCDKKDGKTAYIAAAAIFTQRIAFIAAPDI